jgi:hypothetical protein
MHKLQTSENRMLAIHSRAEPENHRANPQPPPFVGRIRSLLTLLVIITAVCYALTLKRDFTYLDESEYYAIASNLLHHHKFSLDGVHLTAYRPPGYPAALVPILALYQGVRFAKAFNLICWIVAGLLTAQIAAALYGSTAAALALLFVLLYPVSLYTAGTLYPQALTSLLFLLSLYVQVRHTTDGTLKEALFQGVIFAFLIVTVPLYAANLAVFIAFQIFGETKGIRKAIVTCLVAVFIIGIWSLRNYSVFGQFMFASNSGVNLLLGNSPVTGPNSGTTVDVDAIAPEAANLPEIERDAALKKHAIAWIKDHPLEFASLFLQKLVNWFNYRNQLRTRGESSQFRDFVMAVSYYPLLALALLLPFVNRRRLSKNEYYLYFSYAAAALAYAFFFTRIRFRVPFDYLLIILASGTASMLMHGFHGRTTPSEPLALDSSIAKIVPAHHTAI